jgi:hypothetical protein
MSVTWCFSETRATRDDISLPTVGRTLHHHISVEACTYNLSNEKNEIFTNAWNIKQLHRFYP